MSLILIIEYIKQYMLLLKETYVFLKIHRQYRTVKKKNKYLKNLNYKVTLKQTKKEFRFG